MKISTKLCKLKFFFVAMETTGGYQKCQNGRQNCGFWIKFKIFLEILHQITNFRPL